ncbi:MAG: polysaccharide biosynthesis C-terminal domain-containing protein [Lachnospiraceae bacterium]|nr:polysaccharide biosynthesis C-terminal domain-containing protein [Lachnospiraceae bacterium]
MSEKKQSIAKSAILVTLMMLAFKVVAFIKQAFIAYYFGATVETDAYFIAWGFISGISEALIKAVGISIVAIYTSYRISRGKDEAAGLINALLEIMFPCFIIIAGTVLALSPVIGKLLAPSFEGDALMLVCSFIRILAPVLIFVGLQMVFSAMLDSYKSFFIPRLESFLYSLFIIAACVFLSRKIGVNALVLAQYASSVVFLILLIVSIGKFHRFFFIKISRVPEVRRIFITAVPMIIGNSALQINQMVDKAITSGLGEGVTSALYYCHILYECVVNIMIANLGNVMFANFAEMVAKGEKEKVRDLLKNAVNTLIALLFGITVITVIFSKDIVSIVYLRGSFTKEAMILASTALVGYAVSFIAVAVRDLSVQSMFSFADTKHPMIANVVAIAVNICLSILLSRFIGILGVALATSISTVVGMILDGIFLKKNLPEYRYTGNLLTFVKCLPGALILILYCILVDRFVSLHPVFRFLIATVPGLFLYYGMMCLCGVKEMRDIAGKFMNRLKGKK